MDIFFPPVEKAQEIIEKSNNKLNGKPITADRAIELVNMELFLCQLGAHKSPWTQRTAEGILTITKKPQGGHRRPSK